MRRLVRGFTLLEVLIALAVTATALALGIGAVRGGAQTLMRLEESALAQFALENAFNTLALNGAPQAPARQRGVETLLGRSFAISATQTREEGIPPFTLFALEVSTLQTPPVSLASGQREEIDVPPTP